MKFKILLFIFTFTLFGCEENPSNSTDQISETKKEINLVVHVSVQSGKQSFDTSSGTYIDFSKIEGTVENTGNAKACEVALRIRTEIESATVNVSPNILNPGSSGSFDTGWVKGRNTDLDALGNSCG